MNRQIVLSFILVCLIIILAVPAAFAQSLDISDEAIQQFLASPFQYDYTTITDDVSLRRFINVLDYQLAVIEYRQRHEFTTGPGAAGGEQRFKGELEGRYRELMQDGFIYKKLDQWRTETSDPIIRAFIEFFISRRNEFMVDPATMRQARELSQRIADRLYAFRFSVDQDNYSAADAARIIFGDDDIKLARLLHDLINDSVAVLAQDGANLYQLYKGMGQQRGHRTSLDYNLSRLSFRKPEWLKIAKDLEKVTDSEYARCLELLKKETGQEHPALFEIERWIANGAVLPDSCFPPDKIDSALTRLLTGLGLSDLTERLIIRVDSSSYPALAIRLHPPYDNLLLKNNRGGFGNYLKLAGELARALPWVYADTALPYLLREYPLGTEEVLTGLFETLALVPQFLAENFTIPPKDLERFETYRRWLNVSRIRRVLLYFYFDYYLSEDMATNPTALYMSLEDSLFATGDSSYQWIETLITGGLESYPEKLAHEFGRIKIIEILHSKFGSEFASDTSSGKFLIDHFCLPGRSQTLEDYISTHAPNRLSVDDFRRQLKEY